MTPLAVEFTERASIEAYQAREDYESKSTGLGLQFAKRIEEATDRISRFPFGFPEVHKGIRRSVLKQFPFLLFYRTEPNRVVVLACLHERQDSASWPEE